MKSIANDGLTDLSQQQIGIAEHDVKKLSAAVEFRSKNFSFDLRGPGNGNLYHHFVGGHAGSQNERDSDYSFVTGRYDLEAGAVRSCGPQRHHTIIQKESVLNSVAGMIEH